MLENWGNNMVKNRNQCGRFPVGKFFMWKTRDISAASLQLIVTSYILYKRSGNGSGVSGYADDGK